MIKKIWIWLMSEKVMIIWTSIAGLIFGIFSAGTSEFLSATWFSNVIAGSASTAILFGVLNRYIIAVNRERSGEKTNDIHRLVKESEAVLSKREKLLETERTIYQFEQFLKKQSYHNIRFPDLKTSPDSLGLEYTVSPVRDEKTNEPITYKTEMNEMYVIKVKGPSCIDVLDEQELKEYEGSPIRDGEYAFCMFFNGSWQLGHDSFPTWHSFYLSSKSGPVEHGQTANQFMQEIDNPILDKVSVATLYLKSDGTVQQGIGSCDKYEIYIDDNKNLYLTIGSSLPKSMYYTNPVNTYGDTEWFFVIENIRGYAGGDKLQNVIKSIVGELGKLNIGIKKIPWYETDRYRFEPA